MGFQVSPAVDINEIDLTNGVAAVSTSIGAFSGAFQWGPVDEIRLISNETELVSVYGKPDANTFTFFYTAQMFLSYSNALKINRIISTSARNANAAGLTDLVIKNTDNYNAQTITGASPTYGAWAAKYPGALGNSLKVSWCLANSTDFDSWAYKSKFIGASLIFIPFS